MHVHFQHLPNVLGEMSQVCLDLVRQCYLPFWRLPDGMGGADKERLITLGRRSFVGCMHGQIVEEHLFFRITKKALQLSGNR